jgi:hypothetical protein
MGGPPMSRGTPRRSIGTAGKESAMFSSIRILFFALCLTMGGSSALAIVVRPPAGSPPGNAAVIAAPAVDSVPLTTFGAAAVAIMVLCRTQEWRLPWLSVGTFVFGMMAVICAIAIGIWPLAAALGGYVIVCHCRWLASRARPISQPTGPSRRDSNLRPWEESRISRMFGPMT